MKKTLFTLGGLAGALTAIWLLWIQMGGSIPATRQFVKHKVQVIEQKALELSEQSAHHGVEIYRAKLRSLMLIPPPDDLRRRTIWDEIVSETRGKQKFFELREIELHKYRR